MSPAAPAARAAANGQAEVFDLEAAVRAAADEAADVPFEFTFRGERYSIPNQRKWTLKALRAFGKGDLEAALTLIMGEADMERLTEAGMTIGDMTTLFDKIGEAAGMADLPNSSPPQQRGSTRK